MLTFLVSILIVGFAIWIYLLNHRRKSKKIQKKIDKAKKYGLYEPTSIHPYVDPAKCIGSGACVKACPEKDILGLVNGKAALINASRCIGHGACAAACPIGAITLVFGTETRGVDIPYITPNFETNIKGIFIAGELGGMGLIKNAVTQGREAVEYLSCYIKEGEGKDKDIYDTVVVGAGPAGISASLAALKYKLKFLTIEQGDIGGTILQYPRHKIVMTSPMEIPIYGKVKVKETTKESLLDLFLSVIKKTALKINTNEKMTELRQEDGHFKVITTKGEYLSRTVVLAIGRRGTPRKLGALGENLPKVTYRLLEPEQHMNQNLLVVGGGDSAVEAAMALANQTGNNVILSYRGEAFSRIKPMNKQRLDEAVSKNLIKVMFNSNLKEIREKDIKIAVGEEVKIFPNDYIYIFAGGELPNEFLTKIGIQIERKFGKA
ncbi:MAG TPA: 4Fe-4S ferredoxin [Nitrospinae bacterium]|nr:4Fe-4S ferredoxin [Nitrospinota bacterium]HBA27537.1 4Fe-4S ferredoxin [Nitrospinota bacterium]